MNRRSFLKIFGAGLTGAIIVPKLIPDASASTISKQSHGDPWYAPAGFKRNKMNVLQQRKDINAQIIEAFTSTFEYHRYAVNDDMTRQSMQCSVDSFLQYLIAQREIHDYCVVCDLSNNTSSTVNANQLHMHVFYKFTNSTEYIKLHLVGGYEGVSFSTLTT